MCVQPFSTESSVSKGKSVPYLADKNDEIEERIQAKKKEDKESKKQNSSAKKRQDEKNNSSPEEERESKKAKAAPKAAPAKKEAPKASPVKKEAPKAAPAKKEAPKPTPVKKETPKATPVKQEAPKPAAPEKKGAQKPAKETPKDVKKKALKKEAPKKVKEKKQRKDGLPKLDPDEQCKLQSYFQIEIFFNKYLFKDGDQYLHEVGPGGCRGDDWDFEDWPHFLGRQTFDQCALKCAKDDDCTAFHVLRPSGKTFECLHFGHDIVISVRGLGGACYKLEDEKSDVEDEEVEVTKIGKKLKFPFRNFFKN